MYCGADWLWGQCHLLFGGYRVLSRGIKGSGREVDRSPAYSAEVKNTSAEVKNTWSCTSAPPLFLHGVDRHNFTFHHFYQSGEY